MATLVYHSPSGMALACLATDRQLVLMKVIIKDVLSSGPAAALETCFSLQFRNWISLPVRLRQTDVNFEQFKPLFQAFFVRL